MEDQNAHRNVNSEVAEGNEESSKDQDREHSCYILAKTLAIFHPSPQILSKDELKKKIDEQTYFVREISRQNNTGVAVTGCC